MNTYWSTYVQETEELYSSRALRFHDGNKDLWLKAMGIENGMKVLDVGCGSGISCHRIKQYLPDTDITGLDFDIGHIAFARVKAAEACLDCRFVEGDAANLPFDDNSFDLCYSHSVIDFCDPRLFVREQYRVLKPNGKMVVLSVINSSRERELWLPPEDTEEKVLFDRLWSEADRNEQSKIVRYDSNVKHYFGYLQDQGFRDISADAFAVVQYAPDSTNVSAEMAADQINADRLGALCSVKKARLMAPHALTDEEYDHLLDLINQRFDKRIEQYNSGIKLWDYSVATILTISGTK